MNASEDVGNRGLCRSREYTHGLAGGGINDLIQAHGEIPLSIVAGGQQTLIPGQQYNNRSTQFTTPWTSRSRTEGHGGAAPQLSVMASVEPGLFVMKVLKVARAS